MEIKIMVRDAGVRAGVQTLVEMCACHVVT